jgi:hypothetical protein
MSLEREFWHPALWELPDASALQALQRGEADADQQRRALDWILRAAAGTYEWTFVAGQPDVSQHLEGRRSVGLQIVKLLKVDIAAVRQLQNAPQSQPARKGSKR